MVRYREAFLESGLTKGLVKDGKALSRPSLGPDKGPMQVPKGMHQAIYMRLVDQ